MRKRLISWLFRLGVFDRVAGWNRKKITIVQYHGVTSLKEPFQGIENQGGKHITARKFLDQMRYLRTRYRVMSLETIVSHYIRGTSLPDRCAVITFDDGYRNNYSVAYPILTALDLPATIFVSTDFVSEKVPLWVDRIEYALNKTPKEYLELDILGRRIDVSLRNDRERAVANDLLKTLLKRSSQSWRSGVVTQLEEKAGRALGDRRDEQENYPPLSWEQIIEMERSRLITIGSHTATHAVLPLCSSEEVEYELLLSKTLIERSLDRACELFCYPNGAFDAQTRAAVRRAGYIGAVSSVRGLNDDRTDVFVIKRIGVPGRLSLAEFAARVSGGLFLLSRMKSMVVPPVARRTEQL